MAENIQLKSNDGALFEVDRSVIRLCTTLNGFEGNLMEILASSEFKIL